MENFDYNQIYILAEDSKSGRMFWEWLCDNKLHNTEVKAPCERSGWNNYELMQEVKDIDEDDGNIYIVLFDESFDNAQVLGYFEELIGVCNVKRNVFLIKGFYGFESIFLTLMCR